MQCINAKAPHKFRTEAHAGVWHQLVADIEAVVREGSRHGLDVTSYGNAASSALAVALDNAAGRPYDAGWHRAISAASALRRTALAAIPRDHPALSRISAFIDENADLMSNDLLKGIA